MGSCGQIYLGIGGSIGLLIDRRPIDRVVALLAARGIRVQGRSRLWRTPAWTFPAPALVQPAEPAGSDFWNAVVEIAPPAQYAADPLGCLGLLQEVERAAGRDRSNEARAGVRWGARVLDLDILDWRGEIHVPATPDGLHLPHLFLDSRRFVLGPLTELAPDWQHPILRLSASELAEQLPPEGGYPLPWREIIPL